MGRSFNPCNFSANCNRQMDSSHTSRFSHPPPGARSRGTRPCNYGARCYKQDDPDHTVVFSHLMVAICKGSKKHNKNENEIHTLSRSSCLLRLCLQSPQMPSLSLSAADKGKISQIGHTASGKAAASSLMDSIIINRVVGEGCVDFVVTWGRNRNF